MMRYSLFKNKNMVPPAGIEPATPGLENSSGSNQSDPSENPE
jgi:hypothetical protein